MKPLTSAAALLVGFLAAPSAAQTLNASLTGGNAYVWRGVTMADQSVLQGDLSISVPAASYTVTGGAWANYELDPDADRFSSLTEYESGFGEVDLYAQVSRAFGGTNLAVGVTALRFPEIEEWNTFEVFASVGLSGAPLAPSLVVRKDVDAVGGAYAELNLAQPIQISEGRSLVLGGVVGASVGQADDGDLAWYADEGFTHLGASASMSFSGGGFSITPQVNLVYGIDDFAKVDGEEARYGLVLTVSRSIPLSR
jgi:hypothetical protein